MRSNVMILWDWRFGTSTRLKNLPRPKESASPIRAERSGGALRRNDSNCRALVAVADVFDALTSARPYKEAWSPTEAIEEIQRQSGQQFDPQVVDAFLQVVYNSPKPLPYTNLYQNIL